MALVTVAPAHTKLTEPGRAQKIRSWRQRQQQQVAGGSKSSAALDSVSSSESNGCKSTTAYAPRTNSSHGSSKLTALAEPRSTISREFLSHPRLSTSRSSNSQQILCPALRGEGSARVQSSLVPLFLVINLIIFIHCLASVVPQAYSLGIVYESANSSSSGGLTDRVLNQVGESKQTNSPEPAQLLSEPEKSFTTRGLEFVTNIFSSLKPKSQNQETSTTPLPRLAETTIQVINQTESPEEQGIGENEYPSSEDDDDNAEGCKGLSAHESAKGKNLSDAERLVNLQSCIQGKVKRRLLEATRSGMEMFEKLSLSGGCTWSLLNLMSNLAETKSFAFKFLDASAKIPSGVMYGLLSDFGDFDQCLSARSNPNVPLELEAEEGAYSGKYCLMSVKLNYHVKLEPNQTIPDGIIPDGVLWDDLMRNYWTSKSPKGFQVGMCFPSRCSNDDLGQLYRLVAEEYNVLGEIISCQDSLDLRRESEPDFLQLSIIYSFYVLIAITAIGTAVDRYYPELAIERVANNDKQLSKENNPTCCSSTIALTFKIVTCFSIAKNWRIFMRKETVLGKKWIRPDCRAIGSDNSSKTNRTMTERISIASDTYESIDPNLVVPLEQHEVEPVDVNSKLCQLTVKIQPDDFVCEQKQNSTLSHLSGLKLLVIFWITIGHSFLYPSANNYQHYRSIIHMNITKDSVWFATTNFTLGIDMLLYITGLAFVYKLGQICSKRGQTTDAHDSIYVLQPNGCGFLRLITKKILRFWPTYVTVIAFAIVVPLFSDGPMWPEMVSKRLGASCRRNWWSNLLFMNNFLAESEICLPSSWFISVSMQLFLVGSIVVVLERRFSFSAAAVAMSLLLLASCTFSFLYAFKHNLRAPIIRMDETFVLDVNENIWRLYINIFNNLGPFLIGMAGGYLLLNDQARQKAQPLNQQASSTSTQKSLLKNKSKRWIFEILLSLLIAFIAVLVLSSVFQKEYSRIGSSIYWSFHRIGWALVTGYIIHQCATGHWRLLNDLLSLSSLIPFSRLVFIAYLVYPIYIHVHSGHVRDGLHVSIYNMINIYITRTVLSFTTALLIHLLVELPFCSIEEIYLNRWVSKIGNKTRQRDLGKFHPLLAVAPLVSLQTGGDIRKVESTQVVVVNKQQSQEEPVIGQSDVAA